MNSSQSTQQLLPNENPGTPQVMVTSPNGGPATHITIPGDETATSSSPSQERISREHHRRSTGENSSSGLTMLRLRKSSERRRTPSVDLKPVEVDRHIKRDISNTTEFKWAEIFQYTGSVVPAIYLRCILLTVWATVFTVLYQVVEIKSLAIPNQLITILSVVMSLLLVFRTNTAYERYWEARRLWGTMFTHLRNLARFIWISVETKTDSDLTQQYGVMNLLLAFPIATKHYLRDESDIHYQDLYHLLTHLPEYAPGQKRAEILNLPLDITFYISAYIKKNRDSNAIDIPTASNMMTAVSGLVEVLSNVERIRNSPIPFAYFLHLRQTLLVYLLLLPFQLLSTMGWITIPVTIVASFTLLGIESIGGEIENPFGYDRNDLDLDLFCQTIHEELEQIMNRPMMVNPANWTNPVLIHDFKQLFTPNPARMLASPTSEHPQI